MVRGGGESTLAPTLSASSSADQREPNAGRWDWPERFKPSTMKELEMGVNYTYTRRLKEWINKALRAHAESRDTPGFRPHVLALCGVSGCGKSTMVEVLCKEMKVKVMEWTEDEWDMDLKENATVSYSAGRRGRFVGDNYNYSSANDAYGDSEASRYESRLNELNDLERFVRQSTYPQLSLTGTGSSSAKAGGGATTAMHPRKKAKGLGKARNSTVFVDDSDFEFDDPTPRKGKRVSKRKKGPRPKKTVEDSDDENDGGRDGKKPRIVLMHDLPHLMASYSNARSGGASFGTDSGGDTRNVEKAEALAALFPSFRDPVIMIVSDVSEKDDVEFAKRRFMPEQVRHMVEFETIYQNKATTLNIAKTLQRILGCTENRNTRKVLQQRLSAAPGQKSVEDFLLELAESCLGDLRHAVLQLSFISAVQEAEVQEDEKGDEEWEGMVEEKTGSADTAAVIDLTQSDHSDDEEEETGGSKRPAVDVKVGRERDLSYSSLHSTAKICNASLDLSGRFNFDVDTVLASSTMDTEIMFSFIQQSIVRSLVNSQICERHGLPLQDTVREMNELDQVVTALGYCSDIDMYVHRKYDSSSLHERNNNIYPECYVGSLLARLGGVSRTVGSMERMDEGKARGASKQITLMERPKSLDLRSRKRNMLSALGALNSERFREARGGADAAMAVIAPSEVATTMAPLMSSMLALRQRQTQRSAAAVYGGPHYSSCAAGGGGGVMSERIKARVQVFRELAGLQDLGFKRLPTLGDDEQEQEQEQEQPMAVEGDEIVDSD